MKQSKSFLTRCLALALALLLVVSGANLGLVRQAFAADDLSVALSDLIAKNYELTAAEKEFITSGYLNEVIYGYAPFDGEGLVSVDTDAKTIAAEAYKGWEPVEAVIEADGAIQETVAFAEGVAAYVYDGNAFSVKVNYKYEVSAEAASQEMLLNAAANLKTGLADLKAAYNNSDAYVGIVVDAMPSLMQLAEGVEFTLWGQSATLSFQNPEAEAATRALNAEMEANGGLLDLQVVNAAYSDSISKTQYLHLHGAEYRKVAAATYANLSAIAGDPILNNPNVDMYMVSQGLDVAWGAFKSNLNTVINALEPVATGADWNTSALLEVLPGEAYLALDAMLAAIESTTAVAVKFELLVAEGAARANLSMNNVKVIVTWTNAYDETVTYEETFVLPTGSSVQTVAAGAAPIEAAALASWAGFVAEGYNRTVTAPGSALDADIEYVIAYTPKTFAVDYCGEAMEMPYGAYLILDPYADGTKAYDYTVNGKSYAQGESIFVEEDLVVTRVAVKPYIYTTLYKLVAENTDDWIGKILTSGAVKGNVSFKYHMPEVDEAEELLALAEGTLTAQSAYAADYAGLSWVPYTYGAKGTENYFSGNTAAWGEKYANVIYKLELTNFSQAKLDEVQMLAVAIRNEADSQIAALDCLNSQYGQLESLDKTKLGALNGVIDVSDLHSDPAKSQELRDYFKSIVSEIINSRLSGNKLAVVSLLDKYQADGLLYYYQNYEYVIYEVGELAKLINAMTADAEKIAALEILTASAGMPEYADKIANLGTTMSEIVAGLTVPNAAIDLTSENLPELVEAFKADKPVAFGPVFYPLTLDSPALIVSDESVVYAQITVTVNGKTATFSTPAVERGEIADIAGLMDDVNEFFQNNAGFDRQFFNLSTVNGDAINSLLAGAPLNERVKATYTYTPKTYTVLINGNAQNISVFNSRINLPVSQNENVIYEYTIGDKTVKNAQSYTFTTEEIKALFANSQSYTVAVKVLDKQLEELNNALDNLLTNAPAGTSYEIIRDENGYVEKIVANVAADQANIMAFAMGFVELGYSYVGIGNEPLIYLNDEDTTEVCVQTLINAIMKDEYFGSNTIIDLGLNNKGQFLTSTLQLGDQLGAEPIYDVDFVLNLTTAPAAMVKVAKALDGIKNYFYFNSNDGIMDITLNLPEKVYEAYLSALLFTETLDKGDINAINNQIAFNFFADYLKAVIEDDSVTAQTFENTLERLDIAANRVGQDLPDYDLSAYQAYYDAFKKALNENVTVTPGDEEYTFDFIAYGDGIKDLLMMIGIDAEKSLELSMLKELNNNEPITATVVATLTNTYTTHVEAVLVDPMNGATADKLDYETDLVTRVAGLTGPAVIMLMDDIDGDLTFNHPAIIDLNGMTINGKLTANSNVLILDSHLDNNASGSIAALAGNVHLIAGNYSFPVDAYVVDGYKQNEAGFVENVLYTMETDAAGNLKVVISSDFYKTGVDSYLQFAAALAADLTLDQLVNYYNTTAALYFADAGSDDFKKVYDIDFDNLINLVSTNHPSEIINEFLSIISLPDLAAIYNHVIAELIDFGAIAEALDNGTTIADYQHRTMPWTVTVTHIADGDYLTFGIVSNDAKAKTVSLDITVDGDNLTKAVKFFKFMDSIVLDETRFEFVDVEELYFADKHFNLVGGVETELVLDLSDYTIAMAIVMANGTEGAEREALVDAVNARNFNALKKAMDVLSIADVINAMKVVNRGDDFNSLAAAVGMDVEINLDGKKELVEKALILTLAGTGKALAKLEGIEIPERISNNELVKYLESKIPVSTKSTLGNLDKDNDGWYEMDAGVSFAASPDFRGYGVDFELTTAYAHLKVNLFNVTEDDCLWGDADHDGDVDNVDAMLILQYDLGKEIDGYFCTRKTDVNGDGNIDNIDAMLVLQYDLGKISKFPVEE